MSKVQDERLKLYKAGQGDRAIAAALGVKPTTIAAWRRQHAMPSNVPSTRTIGRVQSVRYRELYDQGLTDGAIGRAIGRDRSSVSEWRARAGLPANTAPHLTSPDEDAQRRRLYALGLSDEEIGKQTGVGNSSIRRWRQLRGLAPTHKAGTGRHTPEQRAARMFLYSLGYSDTHIAREQKVALSAVRGWRKRLGLPAIGRIVTAKERRRRHFEDSALVRIRRAVGRNLPPDIAQDAIGDLYLAVLSGKVSMEDIEAQSRKFGNRVLDQFASKYGPRSLDETVQGTEDFTLMDTLVDERSSSWLEEMGATVW